MPEPNLVESVERPSPIPPEIRAELDKPQPDYYAFFGYPEKLTVDTAELQKLFYERSRALHPDRFARAGAADREHSIQASSILNDGYRTLRDPLRRAEYVLTRHGFDVGEQRSNNVPPELLEEVFELNMMLEELRKGDEDARPQLVDARQHFLSLQQDIDDGLEAKFKAWDANRDRETLAGIRSVLNRRRYIQNLLRDVDAALESHPSGADS